MIACNLEYCQNMIVFMNMITLSKEKCVPCEGNVTPLTAEEIVELLPEIIGWQQEGSKKIWREFTLRNFVQAVDFINRIADVAEYQDHHPDLFLHDYKQVRVELMTHAINGLSRNDFIVAAKINEIA